MANGCKLRSFCDKKKNPNGDEETGGPTPQQVPGAGDDVVPVGLYLESMSEVLCLQALPAGEERRMRPTLV